MLVIKAERVEIPEDRQMMNIVIIRVQGKLIMMHSYDRVFIRGYMYLRRKGK